MLYKLRGVVHDSDKFFWDENLNQEVTVPQQRKVVYYIEAPSFQKATTKAKKILDHIHKIEQIDGEFVEVD